MAIYYFWTGSGNWNVLTNWSTTMNVHTPPATLPNFGDHVAFESGSLLLGLGSSATSSTMTSDFSCSAIVFGTGYTGSLTMSNAVLHIDAWDSLTNSAGQVNLTSATIISGSGGRSGFRIYGSSSIFTGGGQYTGSLTLAKSPIDSLSGGQQVFSATHSLLDAFTITGDLYLNDKSAEASNITPWFINDVSGNGSGGIFVNGTVYMFGFTSVSGSSYIEIITGSNTGQHGFILSGSGNVSSNETIFGLYNSSKNYGLRINAPSTNVYLFSDLTTSSFTSNRRTINFYNTTIRIDSGSILIPNSGSTLGITPFNNVPVDYIKGSSVQDFIIPRIFLNTTGNSGGTPNIIFNYNQSTPLYTNTLGVGYNGTGQYYINSGSVNAPLVIQDGQVSLVSAGGSFLSGSAILTLTGSVGSLVQYYNSAVGISSDPYFKIPIKIDSSHFVLGRWIQTFPEQPSIAISGSVGWSNPLKLSGSINYAGPSLTTGSRVQTWQTTGPSNKGSALVFARNATTTLSTYPIVFDQVLITGSTAFTASLLSELSASVLNVKQSNVTLIPVGGGFEVGTYNVQTPGTTQSFGTSSTAPIGNTYAYDFNILNNFLSSGSQASPITYRAVPVNAGRSASLNLEVGGAQHVTWSLNRDIDSGRGQQITSSLGSNAADWTTATATPNTPFLTRQVNWIAFGALSNNTITIKKFAPNLAENNAEGTVTIASGPNSGNTVATSGTTTVAADSTIDFTISAAGNRYISYYNVLDASNNILDTVIVNNTTANVTLDGADGNQTLSIYFIANVVAFRLYPTNGTITLFSVNYNTVSDVTNIGVNQNINLTISPNSGYELVNVKVVKLNGFNQSISTTNYGPDPTITILNVFNSYAIFPQFALIPPPFTGTTSSYAQLALRHCLGSDNKKENWYTTSSYRSQHPNQNITTFDGGTTSKIATFHNFPSTINYYNPIVEVHSTEWPDLSGNRSISNKIRVDNVFLAGENDNVLYRNNSIQKSITDNQPPDTSRLGVYFSPTNEVNQDIAEQFGGFSIDDFIGDPSYLSLESYPGLEELYFGYFKKYGHHWKASGSNADVTSSMRPSGPQNYVRLLKHYDASLFKLIKKFIPYRANAQVGLVIEPHLLSRSKIPTKTPTFEDLTYTSSIDLPEIYIPGGFVQDGDGEPFRNNSGYVQEAVVDNKRVVGTTAEVMPVEVVDSIGVVRPLTLTGKANEYNNSGIDDQPSGYDVGDKLYDEIDFGITGYGRDARVQGSQYIFMTYATSGSGNNVSEPYLITSSRYDYHEPYSPVILDSRRSEIANVTNNIYNTDIFSGKAFQDYTAYGNNATPSTTTTYTSSNAIWENNWTSRFGLTIKSIVRNNIQLSNFNNDVYYQLSSLNGLAFIITLAAANDNVPITGSIEIPAFFYDNNIPHSQDYLYKVQITIGAGNLSDSPDGLRLKFGGLNSTITSSLLDFNTLNDVSYDFITKADGSYLGLEHIFGPTTIDPSIDDFYIQTLKVQCLNYRANVQDFHLQDSYGMRNARYDGCKLTATDYNVDSTDTVDGGPVIQITVGGGNELLVRPGNKGVFTTQTLLKSGQQQIKKKGGLGSL
jgi:hypothetical protein